MLRLTIRQKIADGFNKPANITLERPYVADAGAGWGSLVEIFTGWNEEAKAAFAKNAAAFPRRAAAAPPAAPLSTVKAPFSSPQPSLVDSSRYHAASGSGSVLKPSSVITGAMAQQQSSRTDMRIPIIGGGLHSGFGSLGGLTAGGSHASNYLKNSERAKYDVYASHNAGTASYMGGGSAIAQVRSLMNGTPKSINIDSAVSNKQRLESYYPVSTATPASTGFRSPLPAAVQGYGGLSK